MDLFNLSDQQLQEYHRLARQGMPNPSGYGMRELAAEIVRRREVGEGAASVAPPPPTGREITQSIAPRPSPFPPPQGFGEDRRPPLAGPAVETLRATEAGPLRPGETASNIQPPPPPPGPSPYQQMVDKLLSPRRGGGSPIPNIPRVDVEKLKGEIPKVGEREAQETYKADPYMTMLQTGLRILAAKPELGQSPISAIAGPVGEGVKEYRGEKEKERTSKREEAEAARADKYRQAEAARSTASLGLQASTINTNIALKEMELAQQAAQHGETMSVQRGRLALEAMGKEADDFLKQAQADYYRTRNPDYVLNRVRPLEARKAEIEALLRERGPNAPSEEQKRALTSELARQDRSISYLYGILRAETTGGAGLDRATIAGLLSAYSKGIGNTMAQQDPEWRAAAAKLREMGILPEIPDPNAALPR